MEVEGLEAPVRVDCAFGGMWYAIVDADQLGLKIEPSQGGKIAKLGEKIKVRYPRFYKKSATSLNEINYGNVFKSGVMMLGTLMCTNIEHRCAMYDYVVQFLIDTMLASELL